MASTPRPGTSKSLNKSASKKPAQAPKEFTIPALSTSVRSDKKPELTELEKLKMKTIRRNVPPGEDIKEIRNILKSCKKNKMSVQEFVALISPYTGDNGDVLRQVMNEDLATFYLLARKVYETITQDSSDVLLNQQLQLSEHYRETESIIVFKLNKAVEAIWAMAPNFNFEKYCRTGPDYVKDLFPVTKEIKLEPEEIELMKRQQAYHRLQWLKSEGSRLREENAKLQKKLNEFKKQYKSEQMAALQREEDAEKQHQILENAEAKAEHKLKELSESLEKSIVETETSFRVDADKDALHPKKDERKNATGARSKKGIKMPDWRSDAAKEIDSEAIERATIVEIKKVKLRTKQRQQEQQQQQQQREQQNQSRQSAQETSPFHYSPPKDECDCGPSTSQQPTMYELQQQQQRSRSRSPKRPLRKEVITTVIEEGPPPTTSSGRRSKAPPDQWGGFR